MSRRILGLVFGVLLLFAAACAPQAAEPVVEDLETISDEVAKDPSGAASKPVITVSLSPT